MSFKLSNLNSWVAQIGELVNLILAEGEDGTLNADWFLNPWGSDDAGQNINGIPYRPQILFTLLDQMLSPAAEDPQSAVGNSPAGTPLKWYPIQQDGSNTGVNIVLSDPSADYSETPGYIGIGLEWTKDLGSGYAVSVALFLPIYELDETQGGKTVLCSAEAPAQAIISLTSEEGFDDGETQFSTLQVQGLLALSGDGSPCIRAAFLDENATIVATFTDCASFYTPAILTTLNAALAASAVNDWLTAPINENTAITPGQMLQTIGLLSLSTQTGFYEISDLTETFAGYAALTIAENMVFNALDLIADNDTPLFAISGAGIYVLATPVPESETEDAQTDYGLRFVLADLGLGKVPEGDSNAPANGANAGKPNLTLQIGKWLTGETGFEDSWLKRSLPEGAELSGPEPQPGVTLMFVRHSDGQQPNFHLGLGLVSVGIDYIGSVSNPLVELQGLSLQGIELRGELSVQYDPAQTEDLSWSMGGAARVDHLGLPLGTSYDRTATEGSNPTASNLVASGDGAGGNAATDETDPVNPNFSASASYLLDGQLGVQLYDENDAPTDIVWFPAQATFGPLFCRTLGIGWAQEEDLLSFIVDGGVSIKAFTAELINLSVSIPVLTPLDLSSYDLGLDGINVDFKSGPIEVSAGLLANTEVTPTDYEGQALLRAWRLSISAMGAYSTVDEASSLFIFAMLDFPLGGIPAFFVNGLSAGFGYNRDLILPNVAQVSSFPLVAGIDNPEILGSTPTSALQALGDSAPPSRGDYWLSAGMKWTTYDLVNTDAMVSVEFGNAFELGVIGLSIVSLPQNTDKKFAYAELGLELVLDVGADEFIAAASLSPNSFLIDSNFRLSGGFALDAWWGDDSGHSGDFVVTLGGYAAAYEPPDYYPEVDRLGFSFAFSNNLSMGGDLYFALTTSNIMAGGQIDVSASALGAALWFTGEADLILFWQPFYFDAHMAVTAGASYTISMFGVSTTMKLEAGGSFNLWSPETGGNIEIDFWFFHVPFSFGAEQSPDSSLPVDWEAFSTMLPPAPGSMAGVYVAPEDGNTTEGDDGEQDENSDNDQNGDQTGDQADDPEGDLDEDQDEDQSGAQTGDEGENNAPTQDDLLKTTHPRPAAWAVETSHRSEVSEDAETTETSAEPDPASNLSLVQFNVISGLMGYVPGSGGEDAPQAWLVRPALFGMSTATVIPSQQVVMVDDAGNTEVMARHTGDAQTGILPMAATITEATHQITFTNLDSGQLLNPDDWNLTPATLGMPASMWSIGDGQAPPDTPELIPDCLVGAADLRPNLCQTLTGPPAFDIRAALNYHIVANSDAQDWLPLTPDAAPATTGSPSVSNSSLQDLFHVNDATQSAARSDIFAALAEMGIDAGTDGPLAAMSAQPSGALRANPMLAAEKGQ